LLLALVRRFRNRNAINLQQESRTEKENHIPGRMEMSVNGVEYKSYAQNGDEPTEAYVEA
jgi:hypothetical protein